MVIYLLITGRGNSYRDACRGDNPVARTCLEGAIMIGANRIRVMTSASENPASRELHTVLGVFETGSARSIPHTDIHGHFEQVGFTFSQATKTLRESRGIALFYF
jgi:hypothetical protein